jgi:TP53 regulating kinase-like protein
MTLIGEEIAKMHKSDIIHGDLTTSNMMLRRREGEEAQLVSVIGHMNLPPYSSLRTS